jgi:hypothetical protein
MGKGDNRKSPKMRQRVASNKKKARLASLVAGKSKSGTKKKKT